MNQILYYSIIIFLYIMFALSLGLIICTIIKFKKRKVKYIYISKFFVFFGYFCIAVFYISFIDAIHIDGINYQSNNIKILLIFMIILSILGIVLLWTWVHYEIHIQDDKIVYCNLFYGKNVINFSEIDIQNSKYMFIIPKKKMDFGYEILKIKMKDGKEYRLKLDLFLQDGDVLSLTNTIFKLKIKREKIYK